MRTIYKKLLFFLLLLPFSVLAQTVGGTVLDKASKQPIPGVNVVIKGSSAGTQTDFDGKFKLSNVNQGDVIEMSFLGYQTFSVNYSGQTTLTVSLEEEANELSEVVVQSVYGSVSRRDATGSVDLVTAKDFNKGSIVSVDQLLAGKSAGVRITNNGGQPDSAPNIRIRGGASLSADNSPLIVIDGVPISNDNPAGVSNPFSLINPNDVESFSILKDASATAIYGVRASNGVIIITTKKGTSGEAQFNYSGFVSVGQVDKKIDVMTGDQYVRFIQQNFPGRTNSLGIDADNNPDNNADDPDTAVIEGDNPATPNIEGRIITNTDWQDQIFRTSISSDHSFSARANLYKKIPFRFSLGYNRTEGLVKTNDYKRLSYSFKMTPKLMNDHLKIDVNAKGTYVDKNALGGDGGDAIGAAISMDPTKPIYDRSIGNRFGGYYQALNSNSFVIDGATNPLAQLEQRSRPERILRFLGNVEFDYKLHFFPDLRAVVNAGIDASQARIRETFTDNSIATYRFKAVEDPPLPPDSNFVFNPGLNYLENQANTNTTLDAYLVYSKDLDGFVNKFDIQGGYTYQDFKVDGIKNNFQYLPNGEREEIIDPENYYNRYYNPLNLQAFFGRANIDLAGKYLFTFSFRADGSSLFTEENRWGYFPGAAVAWKIKEESFLKNSKVVQDLKLRIGYGQTGQQNVTGAVGYFPTRPFFIVGTTTSQYLPGATAYSAKAFNPDITWEKTTTYNVGLDFSLFNNNGLSGSIDAYQRETNDLLARVPISAGQYLTNEAIRNVGSTESQGIEVNLNINAVQTEKFSLSFGGNIGYNYAEVTDLKGVKRIQANESGLPRGTGVFLADHAVGEQPYSAFIFEQIYNSSGQPIPGAFVDKNNDGTITDADRYYVALRPNWTYGFSTTITCHNFDFTANFRGQMDGQVYNSRLTTAGFVDRAVDGTTNALNNVLEFNEDVPIAFTNYNGNLQRSDYLLQDASFLRCDNITLGYKFGKFVNKSSLRIYGSVNNVFIVTKYTGQDPENFNAVDNNFYPRPRIFTFGLSLDF